MHNNTVQMSATGQIQNFGTSVPRGKAKALPVVATETCNGIAPVPESATGFGLTLHVAAIGAPLQVSETLPLKPGPAVACNTYCAVCPALTVADVEPDPAESWNAAAPLPLNATDWGEPAPSSVITSDAVRWPWVCGVKVAVMVQLACTAIAIETQLFVCEKSAGFDPLNAMFEM